MLVMSSDELSNRCFQFLNTLVRAALDLSLCKQSEPALDLVEPRSMRGSEVQMVARSFL
jgi:hypothetical protein